MTQQCNTLNLLLNFKNTIVLNQFLWTCVKNGCNLKNPATVPLCVCQSLAIDMISKYLYMTAARRTPHLSLRRGDTDRSSLGDIAQGDIK